MRAGPFDIMFLQSQTATRDTLYDKKSLKSLVVEKIYQKNVKCSRFDIYSKCHQRQTCKHSRPQRPRSFWSAPRIATSGQAQQRKSAIHGPPVTLRMLRVKSDKSDWFWSQSIVLTKPFKYGMSLDRARDRDS